MTEVVILTIQTTRLTIESVRSLSGLIYFNPADDKITVSLNFDYRLVIMDSKGLFVQEMTSPLHNDIPAGKLIRDVYAFKMLTALQTGL